MDYTIHAIGKCKTDTGGAVMLAKHEVWKYSGNERVWAGKYKNSHNLLHWHYDCELIYVESGSIDVFCDKHIHTLSNGQALLIGSGEVHYMHAQTGTILVVIIFDHNLVKSVTGNMQLKNPRLYGNYDIAALYKRIKRELAEKRPYYDLAVKNEIVKLMIDIYRREELVAKPENSSAVHSFKKLFSEISEQCEFITFEEAASFMGMSPAYFSRLFHQISGMTFSQYLNYAKTEKAVHLLQTDKSLSITDVAMKCGFATIRNFNRIFKDLTGYPPKKLPDTYTFDEKFVAAAEDSFDPTLRDCVLIESPAKAPAN